MVQIDFQYLYLFHHTTTKYVSMHCHDCYELCYYYSGSGTTQIDQHTFSYDTKHYAIYAPDQQHDELHYGAVAVACVGFSIKKSPEGIHIPSGVSCDTDLSIYKNIEQIKEEYLNKNQYYRFMTELLIANTLVQCERQLHSLSTKRDEIGQLKRIIDESFSSDLVVENLAKLTGYSYHHFRHLFKERFGIAPKQYIMEKRLAYAKEMLRHSSMSISEIAQNSGFCTSSQLSAVFRKQLGKSPTAYRNEG